MDDAVQASVEQANLEDAVRESAAMSVSMDSVAGRPSTGVGTPEGSNSFAALDNEPDGEAGPSRYSSAVSGTGPSSLVDSAFPPLPGLTKKGKHKQKNRNTPATMAALLGGGGSGRIRVLNMADSRPPSAAPTPRQSSANSEARPGGWVPSNSLRPSSANGDFRVGSWANSSNSSTNRAPVVSVARSDGEGELQRLNAVSGPGPPPSGSDGAPDSVNESMGMRLTTAPSGNVGQLPTDESVDQLSMEEIRIANKALIERIQTGLEGNERQFADFKDVSARFRKGEMNARDYNGHITRLGISYVVPELARLLPDPSKRTELLEAHRAGLARDEAFPPVLSITSSRSQSPRDPAETRITKGEREGSSQSGSTSSHSSTRTYSQPINGEVDVLSTDGYRRAKGKVKVDQSNSNTSVVENHATEAPVTHRDASPKVLVKANQSLSESVEKSAGSVTGAGWTCDICTLVNQAGTPRCAACGIAGPSGESLSKLEKEVDSAGIDKRKKKLSKFQRVRLGDGSAGALLDSVNPNPWAPITPTPEIGNPARNASTGRSFGRGAWNNGGGQRLVSMSEREAVIDSAWGRK